MIPPILAACPHVVLNVTGPAQLTAQGTSAGICTATGATELTCHVGLIDVASLTLNLHALAHWFETDPQGLVVVNAAMVGKKRGESQSVNSSSFSALSLRNQCMMNAQNVC